MPDAEVDECLRRLAGRPPEARLVGDGPRIAPDHRPRLLRGVRGDVGRRTAEATAVMGDGRRPEELDHGGACAPPRDPIRASLAPRRGLDELVERLRAAGVELISAAPVRLDEPGFWHGARVIHARDPDGVTFELIERKGVRPPGKGP